MKSYIRIGKWYDIPKAKNYQISDTGKVKNKKTGKVLKLTVQSCNNGKYKRLIVSLGRGLQQQKVHRLVAETLIPNPENKPCVDHIDGNSLNNCVENLRWVTEKENTNNPNTISNVLKTSFKKGEHIGLEHPRHKVISCYTEDGVKVKTYNTVTSTKNDGYYRSAIQKALKEGIMAYNMYWKYGE